MEGAAAPVRRRSLAAVLAAVAVAFATGGCGDDADRPPDTAEQRAAVKDALRALQRSVEAGDRPGLCARMDATAKRQAGLVAHGRQDACVEDLGEAFEVIDSGGGLRGLRRSSVVAVAAEEDQATATVALDGHGRVDVPLARGDSGWRLGSFFGTPPAEAEAAAAASRTATIAGDGQVVTVADGPGMPCFPLFDAGYPRLDGGCRVGASSSSVRVTIGTAFGHFEFGECELGYRIVTDGKGGAWTDSLSLRGPDNLNNGCADIRECENSAGDPLPWRGRISVMPDGSYLHRMNACLDTCIGFYVGPLTMRLSRDHRGWHATADNAGVGNSGMRFDGRIDLTPNDFELRRVER